MKEQTDRELLELAAKAAGIVLYWPDDATFDEGFALPQGPLLPNSRVQEKRDWLYWNQLTNDGDALRLAVKLHIDLELNNGMANAIWIDMDLSETHKCIEYCDEAFQGMEAKLSATRRAIVRAAAEIGKAMS